MTIEDLKNAKLSPVTAGYLGVYLKLSEALCEASDITEMAYGDELVEQINKQLDEAINKAMSEAMDLAIESIMDRILDLDNNAEI